MVWSFILASASPRRSELLRDAGYTFRVEPADVDEESFPPTIFPADLAMGLALTKAEVVSGRFPTEVVLAADTVVAFGDVILNKPRDADHARWMIDLLAGTTHVVITGVAVLRQTPSVHRLTRVMSAVRMRPMSRAEIDRYVASEQWRGKAGGYGLQDHAGKPDPFVTRMTGSTSNVVGLPMKTVDRIFAEIGVRK